MKKPRSSKPRREAMVVLDDRRYRIDCMLSGAVWTVRQGYMTKEAVIAELKAARIPAKRLAPILKQLNALPDNR